MKDDDDTTLPEILLSLLIAAAITAPFIGLLLVSGHQNPKHVPLLEYCTKYCEEQGAKLVMYADHCYCAPK